MKFITTLFLLVLVVFNSFQIFGQNQVPVVQNVTFSQRTDGTFKVDIYYDVNNPEGSSMIVSMRVSTDNGSTWSLNCPSVTGDIGSWITNGTNKHIIWDFAYDHPAIEYNQVRIKVLADDGGPSCPGIPTILYEGKIYNTVQIGSQCWLRENLNVGRRIDYDPVNYSMQSDNDTIEKYCYEDLEINCNKYGGLYIYGEALKYQNIPGTRGICPEGWHIPTLEEFQTLTIAVSNQGNSLKAVGQDTTSTNLGGFSALLAGQASWPEWSPGSYYFTRLNIYGFIWTSYGNSPIQRLGLRRNSDEITFFDYYVVNNEMQGISVRCIKDQ